MTQLYARADGWELGIVAERRLQRATLAALKAARTPAVEPAPKPAPVAPQPPPPPPAVLAQTLAKSIVRAIAEAWGVPPDGLAAGYHSDVYDRPRFAAYWMLSDAGFSAKTISRALGRRDTSTPRWGAKRARELYATSPAWREKYEAARAIVEHMAAKP